MRFPFPTLDAKINFRVIITSLEDRCAKKHSTSRLCGGHRCWLHVIESNNQDPFPVTCTFKLTKTDPPLATVNGTDHLWYSRGGGGSRRQQPGSENEPPAIVKVTLINSCLSCLNTPDSERGSTQKGQLMKEQYCIIADQIKCRKIGHGRSGVEIKNSS